MHRARPRTLRHFVCALALAALATAPACQSKPASEDEKRTPAPATSDAEQGTAAGAATSAPTEPAAAGSEEPTAPPDPSAIAAKTLPQSARPRTYADATPRQHELLSGAMEKLEYGDTDAAAMFALVLTGDDQPASMEKLIGLLILAEIYRVEENPRRGIERLEAARDDFPPSVELPETLAKLYDAVGEHQKVIDNLREAVQVDRDRVDLLATLANTLAEKGGDATVLASVSADYDSALERIGGELAAQGTAKQRRIELMQALASVRDERATRLVVGQIAHDDLEVVSQAFQLLVSNGHLDAVPMLERMRQDDPRPDVKDALGQVIEVMREIERRDAVPELPVMPPRGGQ